MTTSEDGGGGATARPLTVEVRDRRGLKRLTGSRDADFARRLLDQLAETLWLPADLSPAERQARLSAAIAGLRDLAPRDVADGLLASQMLATHAAVMECLRRAMLENQTAAGREADLGLAARLSNLHLRQLAAYDRRRGRGQQKVTVEHVNVADGGQAIVGNINHRSR